MGKRYYFLKLPDDFFQSLKIKKLRKIAGGDTYTIIYLKMQLLSLKDGGRLFYEGVEGSIAEELALVLDEDVDNVKMTLAFLTANGLIEQAGSDDEFVLPEAATSLVSEGSSAERVRRFRENQRKSLPNPDDALHCNAPVTDLKRTCNVDIDIDKEIEKERELEEERDKEKRKEKEKKNDEPKGSVTNGYIQPVTEIVDYMNQKLGTHYKPKSQGTQKHIVARLKEGFTFEDFKTVIDKKSDQWLNSEMAKYLRPETLFGTKFEGYLNERVKETPKMPDRINWGLKGNL